MQCKRLSVVASFLQTPKTCSSCMLCGWTSSPHCHCCRSTLSPVYKSWYKMWFTAWWKLTTGYMNLRRLDKDRQPVHWRGVSRGTLVPCRNTGPHAACTPGLGCDISIFNWRASRNWKENGAAQPNAKEVNSVRIYPKKLVPYSSLILFVHSLVDLVHTSKRHLWMNNL